MKLLKVDVMMLLESEPKFKTLLPLPWPMTLNAPIGISFDTTLKCQSKRKEDTKQTLARVAEVLRRTSKRTKTKTRTRTKIRRDNRVKMLVQNNLC